MFVCAPNQYLDVVETLGKWSWDT